MLIHLFAPKDRNKWKPIWNKCYKIWEESPHQIKLWDDKEIDNELKLDDPDFYNKLQECPPIYKYDYARYVIILKYGGAYFDLDIEVIRDFFPLLKNDRLYLYEGFASTGVEPAIIISTPGFPVHFFHMLKSYIQNKIHDETRYKNTIENTTYKTGPTSLSQFYLQWSKDNIMDDVTNKRIQVLPFELFGSSYHDLSYCIHHYTNSWHN